MISFYIPEDKELLAAFGELTLRHEHMNHILRMMVKTLSGITVQDALDATVFESASSLRERVRKLAKQRLGEGAALLKLQALVERCRHLTEKRNEFVHSVWAKQLDGEPLRSDRNEGWVPLPSTDELAHLSQQVLSLTNEMNYARLEGFLFQALNK
jgi:hypothetical protein